MAAPRKYPEELKERATRLAMDARADASTRRGAIARIPEQLDVHPEALRNWVRVAEGGRPRSRTSLPAGSNAPADEVSDRERVIALEREVRELKRANTILRQAATFFGAELDRQQH
ncbi:transposase [Flexivirga endophytica]|uniref:Transposase n=1 Tax=Flexivirga endophytica TaxID=1849103 RepID=A0A916T4Z7_9MICO|nr:transposase [Flexivirga endophytica]GHB51475.1 transposase [Flexivirga endophytica]